MMLMARRDAIFRAIRGDERADTIHFAAIVAALTLPL